jgi:hypothetical protein
MSSNLDDKLNKVLETVALNGLVSGYQLKNLLEVPLSTAQRWLSMLANSGELMLFETQTRPIKKKLYGLTFIGFLHALSQPKVKNNFSRVFEKVMVYSKDDELTRKDFQNAVKDPEVLEKIKELFLSLSDALNELYDIESLEDQKLILLARELAVINNPEKMFSILKHLTPRISSVSTYVENYCRNAAILCRHLELK